MAWVISLFIFSGVLLAVEHYLQLHRPPIVQYVSERWLKEHIGRTHE